MALFPDYITVATLRPLVGNTSTDDDANLALAITAASRAIDDATDRQFGVLTVAAARYFTPVFDQDLGRWAARIDDVQSQVGMVVKADRDWDGVYETTLTDYRLWPLNAAGDLFPWTRIVFGFTASFTALLSQLQGSLELTALWGWTAVPDTIKEATALQASRFFRRKDAPFGVAGSLQMGSELRLLAKVDPDVAVMVKSYRHWSAG